MSFVSDVEDLLLRRWSSRRRHCLKATTTNAEATDEERQLRLKVATKVKHDVESKRKRLVNP
jgi:RNase adaptor protein for sRNA GlmZ degradation